MTHPVSIRLTDLVAMLPEPERDAIIARLGGGNAHALGDPAAIRARADTLDPETRELLADLLSFEPDMLEMMQSADRRLPPAEELGLVFFGDPDGTGDRVLVPLEVRVALLDDASATNAPLAAQFGSWEPDDLNNLALLHGLALEDEGVDVIGAAIALANTLTDVERLDGVFDSLPAAAKRLTHWLCEVEEPVPAEKASAKARRFGELAGDPTATSEKVLIRLGIAHEIEVEGDDLIVVPPDLREALRPIIETALIERCRLLYEGLRDGGFPAFRDVFPHGAGGNSVVAARHRAVRAQAFGPDPRDLLDRVLTVFRVLDSDSGIGELASLHLDVATPERFAQECLRSWLGSLDDDFTRVLVAPFGGDCVALADWILDGESPEDEAALDAEDWTAFLYDLRSHLLFVLSVLAPGQWYKVASLAQLVAAVYRRLMWHAGGFHGLSDDAPEHAFPMPGVDVTAEEEAKLYEALVILLAELLEPLGTVQLDSSAQLFMVNPEALRLFRDGDPGFDPLWADVESYVGDDIELWLPIPTSWGARVKGVAPMLWLDDTTLEIAANAHVYDLFRLARWAVPDPVGGSFRYHFDAESVEAGSASDDAEGFLLWLTIRSGVELPGPVRALFPQSASAADSEDPSVAASAVVRRMVDELPQWGEQAPIDLMESIRGYGSVAGRVVLDGLASRVEAAEWDVPLLRHLCVLAGELGVTEATPLLLRSLGHSTFEPTEGAAGTALARIGEAALEGLGSLLGNPSADIDKRLAAAGAVASIAVLHPHVCEQSLTLVMSLAAAAEDLPEDVPTLVSIFVAETGFPTADDFLHSIRDQGLWMDDVMAFDEALWVAGMSPAVWGHPIFAAPLAHLYPPRSEAEHLRALEAEPAIPRRSRRR